MTPDINALNARIAVLEMEQAALALPSLVAMEAAIQSNAARAVVDDTFKPTVQRLIDDKVQAEVAWRRNGQINTDIAQLESERQFLESSERQARIEDANRQYDALRDEFTVAAKSLCRLHQQMAATNHRNARTVPGWQNHTPPRFNVVALNPHGWVGDTSDMLPLPWMLAEQERQAEAA